MAQRGSQANVDASHRERFWRGKRPRWVCLGQSCDLAARESPRGGRGGTGGERAWMLDIEELASKATRTSRGPSDKAAGVDAGARCARRGFDLRARGARSLLAPARQVAG